ncbi:MAG TPA: cell wall hydrolase, partial [Clostridiales bacterium]|nr:cell wall hydrolase [Clostridiales bacterium]
RPMPTTEVGTDNVTSLRERVEIANAWPADYFISIHCNSNVNPDINGTEVYIYQFYTQANWLALDVLDAIVEVVGTKNNEVRANPVFYVLRKTAMPAILVELAYLTNKSDAEKLQGDQFQFAYGIYLGILRYFDFA